MADKAQHDEAHGVGHLVPYRVLILTGVALLILTWITVTAAAVDLGEFNIWVALAIAAIKGSLVALFFMHLRWDRPFNGIIVLASLGFIALFIALAITDTAEYQHQIETGDAKRVVDTLAENQ